MNLVDYPGNIASQTQVEPIAAGKLLDEESSLKVETFIDFFTNSGVSIEWEFMKSDWHVFLHRHENTITMDFIVFKRLLMRRDLGRDLTLCKSWLRSIDWVNVPLGSLK